ncbi:uncharacterized protein LOC118188692 [Stegodyphus dumicola]|uniref:uncharacterized protein LOC118188692 n=1 Tax=Stegodyphus dumicola TaxID=202533 RepID=UPI0015B17C7E|nr:uncharacterized protein LOC118188692 [Stegodyphus dumicola]
MKKASVIAKKNRSVDISRLFPYIYYIMRCSGFLPLKSRYTLKDSPLSSSLIFVSMFFILVDIMCIIESSAEILERLQEPNISLLLIYEGVRAGFLLQGFTNHVLMIIMIRKMATILHAVFMFSKNFVITASSSKYLAVSFGILALAFSFTGLMSVTKCKMTNQTMPVDEEEDCYLQSSLIIPKLRTDNIVIYFLLLTFRLFPVLHTFIISILVDLWILCISKAMRDAVRKSKVEFVLLKNKSSFDFEEKFWVWNEYYENLHSTAQHIARIFSLLLCVSVICNPALFCVGLYWTILQLRENDSIAVLLPAFIVILQLTKLTMLATEGTNFQTQINSLVADTWKLDISGLEKEVRYQLKAIFIREGIDPVVLTAGNFFTISKHFFLSILGAVFTCVVVFVQMASNESEC